MLIKTEQHHGYSLALDRDNSDAYRVQISDRSGNHMASSGFAHTEAESALVEARRIVDAYRNPRGR